MQAASGGWRLVECGNPAERRGERDGDRDLSHDSAVDLPSDLARTEHADGVVVEPRGRVVDLRGDVVRAGVKPRSRDEWVLLIRVSAGHRGRSGLGEDVPESVTKNRDLVARGHGAVEQRNADRRAWMRDRDFTEILLGDYRSGVSEVGRDGGGIAAGVETARRGGSGDPDCPTAAVKRSSTKRGGLRHKDGVVWLGLKRLRVLVPQSLQLASYSCKLV